MNDRWSEVQDVLDVLRAEGVTLVRLNRMNARDVSILYYDKHGKYPCEGDCLAAMSQLRTELGR